MLARVYKGFLTCLCVHINIYFILLLKKKTSVKGILLLPCYCPPKPKNEAVMMSNTTTTSLKDTVHNFTLDVTDGLIN